MMSAENVKVLYPFTQSDYGFANEAIAARLKKQPDAVVVLTQKGRLSDALDAAHVSYFILPLQFTLTPQTFYLTALFKLMTGSLPLFRFVREAGPFKAAFFHDLTSALCWSGPLKMARIPYIVSMSKLENFSKYATITLSDSAFLLCPCPFIKEATPGRFHDKMFVVPFVPPARFFKDEEIRRAKKRLLKENRAAPDAALIMTDAPREQSLDGFSSAFEKASGRKTAFARVSDFETADALIAALTACDFYAGFKPFAWDPVPLFAAMRAQTPVLTVRKGLYMDVIENGVNGVFFDSDDDADAQAAQAAALLNDADGVKALRASAADWTDTIYKKTLDFMKELYDSVGKKK